jgi:hypothetical protein
MPLIRAIRAFFSRRMAVSEPYVPHDPSVTNYAGAVMMVLLVLAIPVIAFLVLVGLLYELIARLDVSGRLPNALRWSASTLFGIALTTLLVTFAWRAFIG